MSIPTISVLMPVHNGERYVRPAVESVLSQSFGDFELIVVDDASTDSTSRILSGYPDARLRIHHNTHTRGIAESLNICLEMARGRYVARMDADDISLPRRLARQVEAMERDDSIQLLGTWVEVIDENGRHLRFLKPPAQPNVLKWQMLFTNPLVHTSVVFRTDFVRRMGGYSTTAAAEDFDLWSRICRTARVGVLPRVLVKWREHSKGFNSQHFEERAASGVECARLNIQYLLGLDLNATQVSNLYALAKRRPPSSFEELSAVVELLKKLFARATSHWVLSRGDRAAIGRTCADILVFAASIAVKTDRMHSVRTIVAALRISASAAFDTSFLSWIATFTFGPAARRIFGAIRPLQRSGLR